MDYSKLRVNTKVKNESLELDEPVSPTTGYLLSEVVTLYILGFMELEIPVDFLTIFAFTKDVYANAHPRFSSIVIKDQKGKKMWKKVEVNAEDHIKVAKFPEDLSAESYKDHYDDYISSITTSQLPQHKPLWVIHIINNPKHINAKGILVFKVHHAIGDGTSMMGVFLSCVKRVDDPTLPCTFPSKSTSSTIQRKMSNTKQIVMNMFNIVPRFIAPIIYSLYDFGQSVGSIFIEDDQTPIRSGNIDTSLPGSTRVCSMTFSLDDVKRIKTLLGVTVNDIVVGIIFFGTQLYIREKDPGQLKEKQSTATIFVNVRSMKGNFSAEEMRKGKLFGNRITNIEVPFPHLEDDDLFKPLQFIKKAHNVIKRKRNGALGLHLMVSLLEVIRTIGGLKAAARTLERRWKNCSFAITNMIGPTDQVSFANHPLNGFYFVPTGINMSLIVSVLTYMDNIRLGFVVENGLIDPQKFMPCVEKAFQLISKAATAT
ncbi:O-acyltransferase WSD1-like [Chenopodium quinoa]|uniref:O-acyltransferase WSD1-like n=1 Tax=Chenopodium quinoa TaxID=63459 RepID=UPI000B773727|nr:O-acyltransferase WSD1-like [Chenopodium quinoa]